MKAISLKLPDEVLGRLERMARRRGQSKSQVVRTALARFLDAEQAVQPGSALEAALPWAGCVEGPADLSTNRQYLEGFGT
jgi:hypothetical protein